MKSHKKRSGQRGKKRKEFHFGLHDCIEVESKETTMGTADRKFTTRSGNGREAIGNGFWERVISVPFFSVSFRNPGTLSARHFSDVFMHRNGSCSFLSPSCWRLWL
ncbi:hypothetical protein CEXT_285291 [Caerostris extrusa]|uniref:Uncharacterized protein n=1 Tax=Caerostris extrusa TaxID=172846 RepID=A0AAV4P6S5_CAEEX|nr:hypothetical protein CEXT_285291 [Caerostris extrusa]